MKFYLAPMEGLTTYIYRTAYHRYFHPMDKYFYAVYRTSYQ